MGKFRGKNYPASLPYLLVTVILVITYFLLQFSDILTFVAFIVLVPIFLYYRFNGKIPVVFALIMFIIAGVVLSIPPNDLTAANVFAIYAFWLLVVGIICLTVQYIREGKSGWPTLN